MKLYDTLTGQQREFAPGGKKVSLYVCGITPYAPSHVGHAMSYVYFDVLRRYLEHLGYEVHHVQNFTDIEDKIIQRAQEEGIPPQELAQRYIDEYFELMDRLQILRAQRYPRATEEIPPMVEMIQNLIDKGYAYTANGDVYFRIEKFPRYGALSRRRIEEMMAGARVEPDAHKQQPLDFVLWKASKPGEPVWESPWGPGRPGWHIECSAMSIHYLGPTLDIHGGGQDLVFPHHENEIAQTEAHTEVSPFAHFWVHNGLLSLGQEKMSKSKGNLVTVREALERFSPDALRLFFLSSQYRAPLTYSEEGIAAQERALERLRGVLRLEERGTPEAKQVDPSSCVSRFHTAMEEDLNTPQALSALFDLVREINRGHEANMSIATAREALRELAGLLGLTLHVPVGPNTAAEPLIRLLIDVRAELRAAKQFALTDSLRERLQALGVVLEDTAQGTQWHYRNP